MPEPLIRDISDTARWVAWFRAEETARKDALFRDRFAARLAGERGAQIARRLESRPWAFTARTVAIDEMILRCVAAGADTVVNLAAGMDARPYRMDVPASLRWIEVDLPAILTEKERLLDGERPVCALERVKLDLADAAARRALFARIGASAKRAVVVTEGLVIYLDPKDVESLSRDLAAAPHFAWWITDLASPAMLRILQKAFAREMHPVGVAMRFGPAEGPRWFAAHGWDAVDVQSILRTAARLRRLNPFLRLVALLPDSKGTKPGQPWGGMCLLRRADDRTRSGG